MAGRAKKGSRFEREFSKRLSMWWTNGVRDDIFWRSSNSGGRATNRAKSGQQTAGQAGDIAATDPAGAPLLELITFELKCGYPDAHAAMMFDRPATSKKSKWEEFLLQAVASAKLNKSFAWMLVHKRDRKLPMIWVPGRLVDEMTEQGCPKPNICIRAKNKKCIYGTTLEAWFRDNSPDDVRDVLTSLD